LCSRGRSRSRRQAGFTLIEILVVLAILGFAASVIISRGPPASAGLQMRQTAGTLVQALRLARSRAIANDARVAVVLDLRSRALLVDGIPRGVLAGPVTIRAVSPSGAGVEQAVFMFAPDGSASGGRVLLGTGAGHIGISVDWISGRVVLDEG
jgi:general secretion pathway protein H